ncbi:hypothetical protein [Novosphingobium aromaticivorans]|uniref:hypothetical protein n=2 Tax=Novosphingobium aromaticivorans TaxID=48935 RepID=UPI0012ED1D22|nr:hypothetical protein [Novosphingobium aromaticivorans]
MRQPLNDLFDHFISFQRWTAHSLILPFLSVARILALLTLPEAMKASVSHTSGNLVTTGKASDAARRMACHQQCVIKAGIPPERGSLEGDAVLDYVRLSIGQGAMPADLGQDAEHEIGLDADFTHVAPPLVVNACSK